MTPPCPHVRRCWVIDLLLGKEQLTGIYVVSSDSMDMRVQEAAASFKEFVERHCLANQFVKIVGKCNGGAPLETSRKSSTNGSAEPVQ